MRPPWTWPAAEPSVVGDGVATLATTEGIPGIDGVPEPIPDGRFGAISVPGSGVSGAGVMRIAGSGAFDGRSWRCRNPATPPCAST